MARKGKANGLNNLPGTVGQDTWPGSPRPSTAATGVMSNCPPDSVRPVSPHPAIRAGAGFQSWRQAPGFVVASMRQDAVNGLPKDAAEHERH
jgi:hypothetical protein